MGARLINEDGNVNEPMESSSPEENLQVAKEDIEFVEEYKERIDLYRASQVPVDKLRYPRAVTINRNKSSRAGLSWFSRHASPKKNDPGLETIWTDGKLKAKVGKSQIKAQGLPKLDPKNASADLLYGYDVVEINVSTSNRNQRKVEDLALFEAKNHSSSSEKSGKNRSQNQSSRAANRKKR